MSKRVVTIGMGAAVSLIVIGIVSRGMSSLPGIQIDRRIDEGEPMSRLQCHIEADESEFVADRAISGIIVLENVSADVVTIAYRCDPRQYLELVVTNENGRVISKGGYGDMFSPFREDQYLVLRPGESASYSVSFFATVDKAEKLVGKYTLQGTYQYEEEVVKTNVINVSLVGSK
jgi:hypothetical protein